MTDPSAAGITGLTVTYADGRRALHDVTVTVPAGSVVAVIGESGCGKSTLVKALLGLLPSTATVSGTVRIDGHDVQGMSGTALRALRGSDVGYVNQDAYGGLDPLLRIGANVEEAWRAKSLPVPAAGAADRLTALGIEHGAGRVRDWPHTWSGGMQQRAGIAAATALAPALVVADEPTSALDAVTADAVLARLVAESQSLLIVSHDLPLVARFADHVYVLKDGEIVEHGDADRVLRAPQDPYTRTLVHAHDPMTGVSTTAPDGDVVVNVDAVAHDYGARRVVPPTTFRVCRGEILGLRGPSGSGKSTLLRILAGLERATTGTVSWSGAAAPAPGSVQMVFQDAVGSLDPRWPIWKSVVEPVRLRGTRGREAAAAALHRLGLESIPLQARPAALSGGQCQRVALARALVSGARLVLADEPTAALDPTVGRQVLRALRDLADTGTAVVMVSHDDRALASVCDRILTLGQ
ncbi:ABC transporter ATP-binding protein [Prescottella subtropica]|uniref:ABC transporter ATP-binding protein n=1 Tax=Prescottella subtropica TaxID=2545757 RepID=UPI0010F5C188|nr:ATP-binding cassette domain-containing protein [Prescottella subtropica]